MSSLKELPQAACDKITHKLHTYVYPQLRAQPHFGANIKKLRVWSPPTWRYRIGPWRFFYEVDETRKIVSLITLTNRKDAY